MSTFYFINIASCRPLNQCFILYRRLSTTRSVLDKCLASCTQLAGYLNDPLSHQRYRILDASWDLVVDSKAKHFEKRIPQSKFFDMWDCSDKSSSYPMMLPSAAQFEDYVSVLGISNDHHVIVYDNQDDYVLFSSPRLWWTFRAFGHDNVSVLNGGLKRWIQEGYSVSSGDYSEEESIPKPEKKFKATFRPEWVKSLEFIQTNSTKADPIPVLEARIPSMMNLRDGETDITTKSVPNATSTPFTSLLDSDKQSIRSKEEINKYFADQGLDLTKGVVSTCQMGITASVLSYCIFYACGQNVPLYANQLCPSTQQ